MSQAPYEQMVLVRVLEDQLQYLCDTGECTADLHFSKGQEAIAVGVQAALMPTDYVVSHHRTIAHAVAKGVPLGPLVAELLGLPGGLCEGRAGEMHLSDPAHRFMFTHQLVGTVVPVAAGLAWAVKNNQKTDDIVVVFHGDAATANGQWHEGMNIAAIQQVPLLIVCENNGLAGNITPEYYTPLDGLDKPRGPADKANGYGMPCPIVDGNLVEDVQAAARMCAAYIRYYHRPIFLECSTTRLGKHKQGQGDLRTEEEIAELAKRDPLLLEAQRLGLSAIEVEVIRSDAMKQVQEVLAQLLGWNLPVADKARC